MPSKLDTVRPALLQPFSTHVSVTIAGAFSPASRPAEADWLLVQALTQNARFTLDGTTPSATVGFRLVAGDPPLLIPLGKDLFPRFYPETAGTILQYQWMG